MNISLRQFFLVLFLTTITLANAATRSDTPVITTDFCQTTALTKIEGTSTEPAGSLIEVFIRVSELDVKVSLGTATVNTDGTWALDGLSVSAGLLSATATASGEVVSLPSAEVAVTVPPIISQGVLSNPTVCGVLDGTVQLLGFLPFTEYDLYYTDESGFQSLTVTADALGQVTISGLGAGEIQEIYASLNGCVSNTICSIELLDPILPSLSLGVPVQPLLCGGTGEIVIVGAPLQTLDYEVSYFDGTTTVGPTTITSSILGTITITGLAPGVYSDFEVTRNGCSSGLLLDRITIFDPILPLFSTGVVTPPSTCTALDGSIQLTGLGLNTTYDVLYEDIDGNTLTTTLSTPLAGTTITLPTLGEGVYKNLRVVGGGCQSRTLGDISLSATTPNISLLSADGPLNCLAVDGSITVDNLVPFDTYDVHFSVDGVLQPTVSATADASGILEVTGLGAGNYTDLYVSQGNCQSNVLTDIIGLDEIDLPEISLGVPSLPSTCATTDGSITLLGLPVTDYLYDITYVNSLGVQTESIMSASGVITISNLLGDNYSDIQVSLNGCESNTIVCPVDLTKAPALTLGVVTPETACGAGDGSISLLGLQINETYDISYRDSNGVQSILGVNSGLLGTLTITGLSADTYSDLTVTTGGCTSEPLADISLGSLLNISLGTTVNPTSCGAADGSIALAGLLGSTTYDVSYVSDAGATTVSLSTDGLGNLIIPGLEAGNYSDISVDNGGCSSNTLLDVVSLTDVGLPNITLGASVNPSACGTPDGSITLGGLLASTTYTVNYVTSAGPQTGSFVTDALGVLTITGLGADSYQDITVSTGGCTSDPLPGIVSLVDVGTPVLNLGTTVNPTTCGASDGIIELTGLLASTAYDVIYTTSGGVQPPVSITSDGSGKLSIAGLGVEVYEDIKVSIGGCISATVGPIELKCYEDATYTVIDQTIDQLSDSDTLAIPSDADGPIVCASVQSGTLPNGVSIDAVTGVITVSAEGDLNVGTSTVTVRIIDQLGDTTFLGVTLNILNDKPQATPDSYTVNEGDTLNVTDADGSGGNPAYFGVLVNDSDIANSGLTANKINDPSHHSGTFTLNPNGTFEYIHDGSETTSDTFSYRLTDGLGAADTTTVTISILPVNDAPIALDDAYTFDEGSSNNVAAVSGVLVNDSDAEDSTLTIILIETPSEGTLTLNPDGSFLYVHNGSETTSDQFRYKVNDGALDSDTATAAIAITPQNDAPVAVADAYTFDEGSTNTVAVGTGVLANDSDADGDAITAILVSDVSNGTLTLNADGSFDYTHDGSETTSDSFTYKVNDGTVDGNTVTVTLTIDPVNDAPVAVADAYTFDEGASNTIVAASGVLANDSDADGNPITAVLVDDVSNGTLTLNNDGSFSYTHDGSETTSDSFTYTVNDGTVNGDTVTVSFTITPQNDAPLAVADAYTFDEGSSNTVAVGTGVLANDSDADGDAITAILVSDVSNGTLTLNADGSFDYTHDGSETTSDSFTYKVNDGTEDGNTVTVTLTITPQNDAPVAVADAYTFDEGSTNTVAVGTGVLA
ncbi:beta strand repeat-containing protein, partial [Marinoscillum furvescens]